MSKICEKCGSVIPDGAATCPTCGREDYNDEAVTDALGELGLDENAEVIAPADAFEPEQPDLPPEEAAEEPEGPESPVSDDLLAAAGLGEAAEEAPASDETPEKPEEEPRRTRKTATGKKKKKRRPSMRKRSAVAIGVLIGLLVALIAIGVGTGYLLYSLGVFEPMSDEELLGTVDVEELYTPSPTPEPEPAVSEEPQAAQEEPEETEAPEPTPIPVESFTLTGEETLYFYARSETQDIQFEIVPEEAAGQIEWTTDNELIASVEGGEVQARRGGNCTITGKAGDKEIQVYVVCDFEVPDTVLDMNYEDITMTYEGQTVQLSYDYTDVEDVYLENTVWESSDPDVATVDEEGVVTAISDGTTVITATVWGYTGTCIVRCNGVTGNQGYNSSASEYVINLQDVTLTRKGEYFQLTLTSVLHNDVPDFKWISDDTSVATVDSDGVVTAVDNGTAYITATIGDDQFRCIVRVNITE